nr:hypothetical protein [Tanacetum cinerariifolium]
MPLYQNKERCGELGPDGTKSMKSIGTLIQNYLTLGNIKIPTPIGLSYKFHSQVLTRTSVRCFTIAIWMCKFEYSLAMSKASKSNTLNPTVVPRDIGIVEVPFEPKLGSAHFYFTYRALAKFYYCGALACYKAFPTSRLSSRPQRHRVQKHLKDSIEVMIKKCMGRPSKLKLWLTSTIAINNNDAYQS